MSTGMMWALFGGIVLGMLALDLGVFHRKSHVVHVKEALGWSLVWIAVAMVFMGFVYFWHGQTAALEFSTGYIIEKSLSVDNLFVFLMIFTHFRVPALYQHKILFWGILGALIMRAIFIGVGVVLINMFHWVIYVFGAILVYSGIKMAFHKEEEELDLEKNMILKFSRKFMRLTNNYANGKFFSKENGKWHASLLLVVLLIVESSDVLFAVDSVPAVLAVSRDPFIVYSSNVFAILGLRSLYFALASLLEYFHLLHYGLCIILLFVGAKMLVSGYYKIPIGLSLGVIGGVLLLSVVASLIWPAKNKA
jgi:tellurite resistance protein TerC